MFKNNKEERKATNSPKIQRRLNGKVCKSVPIRRVEAEQDDVVPDSPRNDASLKANHLSTNSDSLYDALFENAESR